jgi:hypothetical protein
MTISDQRRFTWIHLFIDAMRLGLVNEITGGSYRRISNIQDVEDGICDHWNAFLDDALLRQWLVAKRGRGLYWSGLMQRDLFYLYDLEAELWGFNYVKYLDQTSPDEDVQLEPFRFVLLFYLVERSIRLFLGHLKFLDYTSSAISHSKIRNSLYTHLFDQDVLIRWFPFPFNLSALTTRVVTNNYDFCRHKDYGCIGNHYSVVGHDHYADIICSSLRRAVSWQRKRHTNPKPGSIKAYFFDVLWRYSETYRYRVPLASDYLRENPFYWGLNLRWLGSAFILIIELWLYTLCARKIRLAWDVYSQHAKSSFFQNVQGNRWEKICDTRCQTRL